MTSVAYDPNEWGYLQLLQSAMQLGEFRPDRTGTGCTGLFAQQLRFDLSKGDFPLLTTKRLSFHAIKHELLWFLAGDTNIAYLNENNVHIWDEWASPEGELGPVYGSAWRTWPNHGGYRIDQISRLIGGLKTDPNGRRHIVTAWNPSNVDRCGLPPCHVMFNVYYHDSTKQISLHMRQRSADLFLGVPFNIASYALLLELLAAVTGYGAKELVIDFTDAHVYKNHEVQVLEQLKRTPKQPPKLVLAPPIKDKYDLKDISPKWIQVENYDPYPAIKAPVAV